MGSFIYCRGCCYLYALVAVFLMCVVHIIQRATPFLWPFDDFCLLSFCFCCLFTLVRSQSERLLIIVNHYVDVK